MCLFEERRGEEGHWDKQGMWRIVASLQLSLLQVASILWKSLAVLYPLLVWNSSLLLAQVAVN